MAVYICEFCGKLLHCDFEVLKKSEDGCPFGPCLSLRCRELMWKLGDKHDLCCGACHEKIRATEVAAMGFGGLAMRMRALWRPQMIPIDFIRKINFSVIKDYWKKQKFSDTGGLYKNIHDARARNVLRRKLPVSTFWQRR